MGKRWFLILLAALIGLLFMTACAPAGSTPTLEADIRGAVTSLTRADPSAGGDVLGSLLVEGALEADTGFDRASVTVTAQARIFQQEGTTYRAVGFDALRVGQRVQARFTGPVAESYPVQATAEEIVILAPAPDIGSPLPTPGSLLPTPGAAEPAAVTRATSFLARRLAIPFEQITVISYEWVEWPDTSLGCPQPGMAYAQVIVPGYRVLLEVAGSTYLAHTNSDGSEVVICQGENAQDLSDPEGAFQALLAYFAQEHPGFGLTQQGEWGQEDRTPAERLGSSTLAWRGGEWEMELTFPVIPQPAYRVTLSYRQAGVVWSGTLEPDGQVIADVPLVVSSMVTPCDQSIGPEALQGWAQVEASATGGVVHISQKLSYVCCADLAVSAGVDGHTVRVIETNVGEICRCICGYPLSIDLEGLPPGAYTVEVWGAQHMDVHPLELLGRVQVEVE